MGGQFLYRQVADSLLIDAERVPTETTQQELTHEVEAHQALFDLDHQYCVAVEGASQESNLWVPRNQAATGLTDVDLQRFKSIAWNECVVKRFLTSQSQDVSATGASMLHIVQTLNLQWKGMEVTGLHPKVESAEKQVVMACMEKRLLPYDLDVGRVARCLRRCHHFRDHFANAVGCHVVAKTGHTPGLSKTQYTSDLDYVYKNQGLFFLHSALSKNKGLIAQCLAQDGLDYVPRLCSLKLVSNASVTLQNPPEKEVKQQIIYEQSSPKRQRVNAVQVDTSGQNTSMIYAEVLRLREIPSKMDGILRAVELMGPNLTRIEAAQNNTDRIEGLFDAFALRIRDDSVRQGTTLIEAIHELDHRVVAMMNQMERYERTNQANHISTRTAIIDQLHELQCEGLMRREAPRDTIQPAARREPQYPPDAEAPRPPAPVNPQAATDDRSWADYIPWRRRPAPVPESPDSPGPAPTDDLEYRFDPIRTPGPRIDRRNAPRGSRAESTLPPNPDDGLEDIQALLGAEDD